jgi:hypothetical protein
MTRDQQVQYIRDHYLTMTSRQMEKHLGRSRCFIRSVMQNEGLSVPRHIIEERINKNKFKPGKISWNKGKPFMSMLAPEKRARIAAVQFQPGQQSHNTAPVGDVILKRERGRYYWRIKLAQSRWEYYHRHIWKQHHGPIPKGHNVQFKNGDTMDCRIENLYMISRKQQGVINKAGGAAIPYELHSTVTLLSKLNQTVRHHEKQGH